jgi:O-antigen/teichoic acid export membrane protein
VGVLINCFVHVPSNFLCGLGRPDVIAKLLLLELPFYVPFCYLMIRRFGIEGAALAWSVRVVIEVALLMMFTRRLFGLPLSLLRERSLLHSLLLSLGLAGLAIGTVWGLTSDWGLQVGVVVVGLVVYAGFVWKWGLDDSDRETASGIFCRLFLGAWGHDSTLG